MGRGTHVWLAALLAAGVTLAQAAAEAPTPRQALEAAVAAGDWLVRTQRADGEYAYLYDPSADRFSQEDYSFVRHAGVVWSLLELHRRTGRSEYLRSAQRGLARLERQIRRQGDAVYVVSRDSAPLGGAALAALAYLALPNAPAGQRETASALGRMVLRLQRPDGSFASHYSGDASLASRQIDSLYYPGEAMLALTRLSARTHQRVWLDAARAAARYLATRRDRDSGYTEPAPDQWFVIAAAELAPLLAAREANATAGERAALQADVREIADYAFRIADTFVAQQITEKEAKRPEYAGGANSEAQPRSTPAATRGEALAAACRLADALGRPRARYLAALQGYARFVLRLQHRPPAVLAYRTPRNALGSFAASADDPSTRMDFQQHAISCLLELAEVEKSRPRVTSDE